MFAWIAAAGQWLFNIFQAGTSAVVAALVSTVSAIWKALRATSSLLSLVGRKTWRLLDDAWDHVLKPAWTKFYRFVDRLHDRLERIFGPTLRKINELRKKLTGWWTKYVRPILDAIDIARAVLRTAANLGLDFARKLDDELAKIQNETTAIFIQLIQRLNEVGDWIDRIIGLDGLFKRLVLVRSIERDIREVSRAIHAWRLSPLTAEDLENQRLRVNPKTERERREEFISMVEYSTAESDPQLIELVADLRLDLRQTATGGL